MRCTHRHCRCVSGSCVQCCWEQVIYAATSGTGQERNSRPAGPSPRSNRAWSCGSARRLRRQSSERQRQKFQNSDTTHDTRHSNSTALDRVLKNKVGMYQSADRAKRNTFHSVCPSVIARDVPQHGSYPLPTVSRVGHRTAFVRGPTALSERVAAWARARARRWRRRWRCAGARSPWRGARPCFLAR